MEQWEEERPRNLFGMSVDRLWGYVGSLQGDVPSGLDSLRNVGRHEVGGVWLERTGDGGVGNGFRRVGETRGPHEGRDAVGRGQKA